MKNIEQNRTPEPVTGIGLVDKQNGGNGQYAKVEVTIHSQENSDTPNTVVNAVVGGAIPTEFMSSVLDGVREGLKHGPLGGFPITGVEVRVTGGKAHPVDSNTQVFKEAGRLAAQDALQKSEGALLEPMAKLEVSTPAEFVGAVVGDINRRRGQITDMVAQTNGGSTVKASVPLGETFGYATDLRSLTQGRASFVLEPNGYAEAPHSVRQAVVVQRGGNRSQR